MTLLQDRVKICSPFLTLKNNIVIKDISVQIVFALFNFSKIQIVFWM